jgi:AcrR family transcriptional regulator
MSAERLGPKDWADAALDALAERGIVGVAVEPLARALGVTKGSFYWHFKTREELLRAAAERWGERSTTRVIERMRGIESPRARVTALIEAAHASEKGLQISRAFAALADDPTVGPIVKRVSAERIAFIAQCYRELGASEPRAQRAARIVYAAYLGLAELERLGLGVGRQRAAYVTQIIETLVPAR